MPLIIKGDKELKIISKKEMNEKIHAEREELNAEELALSKLPKEVAERRREILDAKRHREFMAKVARTEEEAMRKLKEASVEVTNELVVETGPDPIVIKHDDVVKVSPAEDVKAETPDFEAMTKKELDEWAEETLGLALDRRKKKADMIEIIKKSL
jgi:hypothetical protein